LVTTTGAQLSSASRHPILLAEGGVLHAAAWNDLEHVRVTRAFLNDPQAFGSGTTASTCDWSTALQHRL
jgi:predicted ATPase